MKSQLWTKRAMWLPEPQPTASSALKLRDYQRAAVDAVHEALGRGVRRQLISLPTGAGKTFVAAHLVSEIGRRTVFMVHRDELARQTVTQMRQVNPALSIGVCKANQDEVHEDIVVASAQTLAHQSRLDRLVAGIGPNPLFISDECFPAGTLIDEKAIELIRIGDIVTAFDEESGRLTNGRVVRLFRRPVTRLVTIMVGAERVTCTPNHPFWTKRGWVRAGDLIGGFDAVLRTNSLQPLRRPSGARFQGPAEIDLFSRVHEGKAGGTQRSARRSEDSGGAGCVLQGVRGSMPEANASQGAAVDLFDGVPQCRQCNADGIHEPPIRFRSNEGEQPNAPRRQPGAHEGDTKGYRPSPAGTWRQWDGPDRSAGAIAGGTRGRVGARIPGSHTCQTGDVSRCLETGHRPLGDEDRDRGGRPVTQRPEGEGGGCSKGCLSYWARVDSVEIQEPGSDGRFGGLCPDGFVYNFEVEGLHTYTANGFVVHNCHHDRSPTRMRAIDAIVGEGILVGLTATPKRGDKLGLDAVYEEIVYHLPMRTLVERKHLARPVGLRIETESDLDSVHTVAGEFNERELANEVDTDPRNRLIVESWKTHAADRKRTVVFCVTVRHAERVRDAFRAEGISAEMVDGGTPVAERQRIFAEFAKGDVKVLTNCMVLTEGFDEPGIDCAIMARPTKSSALYIQCVGRALRFRPDKPDALIIDMVDVTSRHQLVTLPSLSGSELQGREREVTEADRLPGQAMDLFDALSHNGKLREREAIMLDLLDDSPFIWQSLPDGTWMSPAGMGRWVTLLREGEEFVPVRIIMDRGEPPAIERLLDRPVAADIAMGIATDHIPLSVLNQREAHWRRRPATDRQKSAAARWRVPVRNGATAGELSDLIDMAAFRAAQKKLFGRAS